MNLESSRLKAFNSFLFFITLTMYFELFIFFKDLKNIFDGGHRWLTADWLINYNFGFVRRGMFGSFFINLPHEYSNILFLIEYVLFFIYLGTLFLFFYVSYQFIGTSTLSIFLLSPVFLKFIFFNQYAGFRKEMLCITTIVLLVAYKKSDRKIFYVLSFLFYVLSVFSSEYGFMLFFPIFFLLLVKNNENVKTNIGFTIMPPLIYLILHIMNSDKYFQKSLELCQSIKKLNPFNYSNYICEGQIHWIGLSSVETINITKSYYDMQYILYYLIMFCVGLIPLVITGWLKKNSIFFTIQSSLLILFFVLATDWGRTLYLFYSIFYVLAITSIDKNININKRLNLFIGGCFLFTNFEYWNPTSFNIFGVNTLQEFINSIFNFNNNFLSILNDIVSKI